MALQHLLFLIVCVPVHSLSFQSSGQGTVNAHKHVTYFVFSGKDDVLKEASLSIFSLCRLDDSVRVLMVTDDLNKDVAASAITQISEACWKNAKSEQLSMVVANVTEIQSIFSTYGYTKMKHHSGFGGYAKMIAAKLIPESIDRTIVVDSDTIFNAEFEQLWSQFNQFSSAQVLMGKRLDDHYCLSNGNRINSGVVPMDLKRMRDIDWTGIVLSESRNCHECAGGDTLLCGDQEFISFGCQQRLGACGDLDVRFHFDYCNERGTVWDSHDAVIYHFNCGGDVNRCPGHECKASVSEWNKFTRFNQTQTRTQGGHSDLVFDLTTWTWMAMNK